MWYLPSSTSYYMKCKHFTNNESNWDALLRDVMKYLNTYIAPHQLISISIFEEDHPNNHGLINAIVTHKGDDSAPLNKPEDIQGDIYRLKFYSQCKSWDEIVQKACNEMDHLGVEENRFQVATSNYTKKDSQALAL